MIYIILFISLILSVIALIISSLAFNKLKNRESYNGNYKLLSSDIELSPKLSKKDIINLKEGQKKMSNMLKVFDDICQKNNIRYFLIAGSLIGALAYKGWIPWDGDVDVEVHENDYDKLKKLLKEKVPKNMWFQNRETDKYYPENSNIIGKLRDLNSCYIEYTNNHPKDWHNGLQIDINIYKEKKGKIIFPDDKNMTYLTAEDIYPLKRVQFDDFYVNVMNNSEKYLLRKYGKGWVKVLPIEKRLAHEGKIDGFKTCPFHYEKYPHLYKK